MSCFNLEQVFLLDLDEVFFLEDLDDTLVFLGKVILPLLIFNPSDWI
jgi:hypothetical protein